jgi:hypothetical protein
MVQGAGGASFERKTALAVGIRDALLAEHLDRNFAPKTLVLRAINFTHAFGA